MCYTSDLRYFPSHRGDRLGSRSGRSQLLIKGGRVDLNLSKDRLAIGRLGPGGLPGLEPTDYILCWSTRLLAIIEARSCIQLGWNIVLSRGASGNQRRSCCEGRTTTSTAASRILLVQLEPLSASSNWAPSTNFYYSTCPIIVGDISSASPSFNTFFIDLVIVLVVLSSSTM